MTAISVIGEIIFKLADFPSTFGTKRGVYWLDAKFGSSSNTFRQRPQKGKIPLDLCFSPVLMGFTPFLVPLAFPYALVLN